MLVLKDGDRMSTRTQASPHELSLLFAVCVIVVGAIKLDSKQIKGTMNGQANYVKAIVEEGIICKGTTNC